MQQSSGPSLDQKIVGREKMYIMVVLTLYTFLNIFLQSTSDVEDKIQPGFEPGCSVSNVLTEPLELWQYGAEDGMSV